MRGVFEEREFNEVSGSGDKELTLGPMLLTALGVGLLALCGVCFVAGYAVGRRAPVVEVKPTPEASVPPAVLNNPSLGKPTAIQVNAPGAGAAATNMQTSTPSAPVTQQASPLAPVSSPAMVTVPVAAHITPQATASQPIVRPALPVQTYATQGSVQPAINAPSGIVVQVAVVSQQQDADALVNALRKRGYSASVRRVLGDQMLHVQVGPFASRTDAMTTRQKLLDDGYNAVVE
ncbi:MAG: SPOR domain-containing protein [Acidobacteriota bacterium]|nr:SPOR domain-containing protein [Acidobacteriota bacterium]